MTWVDSYMCIIWMICGTAILRVLCKVDGWMHASQALAFKRFCISCRKNHVCHSAMIIHPIVTKITTINWVMLVINLRQTNVWLPLINFKMPYCVWLWRWHQVAYHNSGWRRRSYSASVFIYHSNYVQVSCYPTETARNIRSKLGGMRPPPLVLTKFSDISFGRVLSIIM